MPISCQPGSCHAERRGIVRRTIPRSRSIPTRVPKEWGPLAQTPEQRRTDLRTYVMGEVQCYDTLCWCKAARPVGNGSPCSVSLHLRFLRPYSAWLSARGTPPSGPESWWRVSSSFSGGCFFPDALTPHVSPPWYSS